MKYLADPIVISTLLERMAAIGQTLIGTGTLLCCSEHEDLAESFTQKQFALADALMMVLKTFLGSAASNPEVEAQCKEIDEAKELLRAAFAVFAKLKKARTDELEAAVTRCRAGFLLLRNSIHRIGVLLKVTIPYLDNETPERTEYLRKILDGLLDMFQNVQREWQAEKAT